MSPKKTFCVYATTSKEKIEWMTHISNCIEKLSDSMLKKLINLTRFNAISFDSNLIALFLKDRRKGYDTIKDVEVAPQWIPDKETETCMRCRIAKFTLVNRRV
jgi:hypothetical protein